MTPNEFQSARKFESTSYGRIAYVESGSGVPALFLHGLPLCGFQWRGVIDDLADRRRCIAPDLMGVGYSEVAAERDISFLEQARMVAAFLDTLRIDAVDLCGNDTGGGVSQIFAALYPARVRSLTLTNCEVYDLWPNAMLSGFYQGLASGAVAQGMKAMLADAAIARQQFSSVYEHPEILTPELVQLYIGPLVASDARIAQLVKFGDWARNRTQLAEQAPRLKTSKIPAQVIWGEADTAFDTQASLEWLRANLGGLVKTIRVPRAKLFFPEEHPRLVSVLLNEFWRSIN